MEAQNLLTILSNLELVTSATTLKTISTNIKAYLTPFSTVTPQTIPNLPKVDGFIHSKIIEHTLNLLLKCPDQSLISLAHNLIQGPAYPMINESLQVIIEKLKTSSEPFTSLLITLLEELTSSDTLYLSLVTACSPVPRTAIEQSEFLENWRVFSQLLVSLPTLLANKTLGKVPKCFKLNNYAQIITYNISRAVKLLNKLQNELNISPNVELISSLISKSIYSLGSFNFSALVDIFSSWSLKNSLNINEFIYKILENLERSAVEPFATLLLKQTNNPSDIETILRDSLRIDQWRYVLTTKIPLLSFQESEQLIKNLVFYLSSSIHENRPLVALVFKLLDIWGDRSALNHCSVEHHEYISKFILISIKKLQNQLTNAEKEQLQRLLFEGTSVHLESMLLEVRILGMITGELVLEILNEKGPKLKYEYPEHQLVDKFRNLATNDIVASCFTDGDEILENLSLVFMKEDDKAANKDIIKVNSKESGNLGLVFMKEDDEVVNKDRIKVNSKEEIEKIVDKEEELDSDDDKALNKNKTKVNSKEIKKLGLVSMKKDDKAFNKDRIKVNSKENKDEMEKSVDKEEELDSDDDLEPYDLSNDTPVIEKLKPAYLRDLRDNLITHQANKDPDIFSESMKVAEELILKQLPSDDKSLGLELLRILMTLKEEVYTADFYKLKFRACVGIVLVYPKEAAEFLCASFHASMGEFSISDRIFFLSVLAEGARRLSRIEVKLEDDKYDKNGDKEVKEVRNGKKKKNCNISLIIERKKNETLYDEDFEVVEEEENRGWEEIVQKRIESKTRRFAHESKRVKGFANKFNDVATGFFYPLLFGVMQKRAYLYKLPDQFVDTDNILLVEFLKTLSVIMVAAENCVAAGKIARDLMELVWTLRFHEEAKVRLCVIENIAAVIVTLKKENLGRDTVELMLEFRSWLVDLALDSVRGDPNANCRNLARNVVALIDSVVGESFKEVQGAF
ncbi:telomere length regulation protein TEL2 homolog isoform X1 [Cotesia glomerata]|nr:telomere length regulation protein TEL2 homolog isoform X1 [Cotesia glomerata]XP_044593056.1 telomere length regulation protein TEL2 homolog isoform X1 [Cotesia glomerata]